MQNRHSLPALSTLLLFPVLANAAPVVSWRFDEAHQIGPNIRALAGPDIPMGDAYFVKDAQGQALALDRQSILIADDFKKVQALMPTQNLTASMWVSVDAGRQWGGLLGAMQDNGDYERGWILGYEGDKFSFAVATEGKGRMTYLLSKTAYVPGRWYHLAGTYDGKTMSLYVNGVLEAQSTEQSGKIIYPPAAAFVLGAHKDDNADYPMKGRIREAQLELDALPAAQIQAQFQANATLTQLPSAVLAPPPPAAAPSNKKVLIIGTDGTRSDKMEAANIPNIRALIASGAYTGHAHTRMPTVSGPSWSSMMTGVWSDKHGVKDNGFKGKNYEQYPDFLTRLEKINPDFSTFAAADWEPIVTGVSGGPLISDAVDGKIYFKGHTAQNDQRIADAASNYLKTQEVDAAFVYLGNVDGVGHGVGPLNPKYTQAIEAMDKQIGQLVAAVRRRPNYANEDWLILISTDHGHVDGGGHGGPSEIEKTSFLVASGKGVAKQDLPADIEVVDIGMTALAHLGVLPKPSWAMDGKVLTFRAPGKN